MSCMADCSSLYDIHVIGYEMKGVKQNSEYLIGNVYSRNGIGGTK